MPATHPPPHARPPHARPPHARPPHARPPHARQEAWQDFVRAPRFVSLRSWLAGCPRGPRLRATLPRIERFAGYPTVLAALVFGACGGLITEDQVRRAPEDEPTGGAWDGMVFDGWATGGAAGAVEPGGAGAPGAAGAAGAAAVLCGNGVVDSDEDCEDGNTLAGDGCSRLCRYEREPTCGDGRCEGGETCDDGNTLAGDGCSAGCILEHNWDCPYPTSPACGCGNGMLERGEGCDDGNLVSGDGCSAYCESDVEDTCGNEIVDQHEECDDGDLVSGDGCSADCRLEGCFLTIVCGDGIRGPGEGCDDGNVDEGDGCSSACVLEPGWYCPAPGQACVMAFCGDGIVQAELGEQCDDGINDDGYDECAPGCVLGPYCGDGLVQPAYEECDDGIQDDYTGCTNSCTYLDLP